ncbi:SEC-C metal-binding domain-containing protein [Saccharopolyspora sp. ID03-671]|uniref:SEC-C metal-binding domain-containing protein n=1 Tax=Saccharopolyspora sp. ID03-671 TaxID=3073066 RepID=UPI0038730BF0
MERGHDARGLPALGAARARRRPHGRLPGSHHRHRRGGVRRFLRHRPGRPRGPGRLRLRGGPRRSGLPWPPGRNDTCWCGSGRKYKKCCGAPGFA